MVTEEQLAAKAQEFLQNCDLKKTTNSIVIKKLEDVFGVDLSDKKPFLRYQVGLFLQSEYVVSEEDDDDSGDVNRKEEDDDDDENDDVSDDDSGVELYDEVPEVKTVVKVEKFGECKLNKCDSFENYGAARLDGLSDILRRPRKKTEKIKRTCVSGKYCTLSPELQKFLGVPHLTRTEVVKQLWFYVKEKSLKDPNDGKTIICDEMLRGLFGVDSINILQINKALTKHITPSGKSRKWYKRKQEKQAENLCEDELGEKRQKKEASVFFPPLPLSDTLKRFLNTEETALTRADVIKRVWDYIKQKNLKDPTDKKTVICDEKLKELVNVDSFHGFTLTKLLSPHFVKT